MIRGKELKIPAIVISDSYRAKFHLSIKSEFYSSSSKSMKERPMMEKTMKTLMKKLTKLVNLKAFNCLGKETMRRRIENMIAQAIWPS